jgi:hypothetical protein
MQRTVVLGLVQQIIISMREVTMSEDTHFRETVSIKELLVSNTYTQEAIINLLDKRGIINKEDIFDEIIRLRDERIKTNRRVSEGNRKVH